MKTGVLAFCFRSCSLVASDHIRHPDILRIRVFAICQIMWGWESYKYYYETDEFPNPRPTQPKKNSVKSGVFGHFFQHQKCFSWVRIGFIYR